MIAPITLISPDAREVMLGVKPRCTTAVSVSSLEEMREHVEGMAPQGPASLDLLGHSARGTHLLCIGKTTVDMFDPKVAKFFQALAADGVLAARQIVSLRLLGCETATQPAGKRTIQRLARMLGVKVYGSVKPLGKSHYDERGFVPVFHHLLVEASQL